MNDILKSNRYRYLHGGLFFSAIITSLSTAFMSIFATKMISKYALGLPTESFDVLYANGYYNFGLLKVKTIQDLSHLSAEQVISSAFMGWFLPLVLAIFIPMFISGAFKGGFIQSAFIRGNSKSTIITAYVISASEIFIAVFVAYIVSLLIFSTLIMGVSISEASFINCLAIFARELFAHFVFLVVCISLTFVVNKASTSIVSLIFSIIAFPGLLSTADLVLQKDIKFSSLWIVNIIGLWSMPEVANFTFNFVISMITLAIATGTAMIMFVYSELRQ